MSLPWIVTISHRGAVHKLSVLPDSTLEALQLQLEQLTRVPTSMQKLLYKGRKNTDPSATVTDAGLKDGIKVQLLGSTAEEVGGIHAIEDEQKRRERIMRERALKPQVKLRSTGSSSTNDINFRFHHIQPLAHLPKPEEARAVLTKLANDPAILHIMKKHQFSVGLLTELAPHEHPELLGLNKNAGESILLRIRTDIYDGFRSYREIRRVACHELTHNKWGDHDNNFKELNSQLNREVAEFEQAAKDGTHHLDGGGDVYMPSFELEAEARAQILGGSNPNLLADSQEDRRRRILDATMKRLRKEEEELEESCGTTGKA